MWRSPALTAFKAPLHVAAHTIPVLSGHVEGRVHLVGEQLVGARLAVPLQPLPLLLLVDVVVVALVGPSGLRRAQLLLFFVGAAQRARGLGVCAL